MIWKLPKRRTVIKIILITTAILVTIFNMVVVIPQYPQYTWQFMLNLSIIYLYTYFYFRSSGESVGKKQKSKTD